VPERIVVVGAGLGGLRAAEQLRSAGFTGEVVILGDEEHLPYNRPPLSKEALAGDLSHQAVVYPRKASVEDVTWRLGESVRSADLDARAIALEDGSTLEYDGIVAATGVSARRLPLDAPHSWRHVVRTLDDATRLRADLVPGAAVVVIGAGFIGCEVAATARTLGCTVDVVDPLPVPLVRPLGEMFGTEIRRRHEAHGVAFHLGRTVGSIEGNDDGPNAVVLDDGTQLPTDVIVEAVGSLPNVGWLDGNGLDLTDGVRCDHGLRPVTADGPVRSAVAVGDIARFPNPIFDDVPRRIEHWNIPTETAKRAARVLVADLAEPNTETAGSDPIDALGPFRPMPAFWSDQFEMRLQSFGLPSLGPDDIRVLEGDMSADVAVGYYRDGALVGVALLGLAPRFGYYRTLIARGGRLDDGTP
jgi:3-phenylpropionate/trans-cinnamate dioxygenase ferredoxin reductase component